MPLDPSPPVGRGPLPDEQPLRRDAVRVVGSSERAFDVASSEAALSSEQAADFWPR